MGILVDYFTEKNKRHRANQLKQLMSEASEWTIKNSLGLDGVLVVFKVTTTAEKPPDFRYSQEGFTHEDLKRLLTYLEPPSPPRN